MKAWPRSGTWPPGRSVVNSSFGPPVPREFTTCWESPETIPSAARGRVPKGQSRRASDRARCAGVRPDTKERIRRIRPWPGCAVSLCGRGPFGRVGHCSSLLRLEVPPFFGLPVTIPESWVAIVLLYSSDGMSAPGDTT